ncbi:Transporter [hydrothermal vent metagenome]|uniref:Transporter n=1 Tax=hydrothermal vent metagenome TaxID=652676 RepID=A0A1W1C7N0_9ZZZZ
MFELTLKNKSYLLIFSTFLIVGCGEVSANSPTQISNKSNITHMNITQEEFLDAINKVRSTPRDCYPDDPTRGFMKATHPLTWNNELYASALEHSTDLANSDTFSHLGSGTEYDITGNGKPSKFFERIVANGYKYYYSVGENIAGGQTNLEDVMDAWLKSPEHCTNIMKDVYDEVGMAVVLKEDSTYGVYWTQNFGTKTK